MFKTAFHFNKYFIKIYFMFKCLVLIDELSVVPALKVPRL